MIDLKRYQALKSKVDRLQTEADRAEGALAQLTKQLQDEYDCGAVDEAEVYEKKLRKRVENLEAKYRGALEEFEDKWGEVLG